MFCKLEKMSYLVNRFFEILASKLNIALKNLGTIMSTQKVATTCTQNVFTTTFSQNVATTSSNNVAQLLARV